MIYCKKCGAKLPWNARFCTACGEKVAPQSEKQVCPSCGHAAEDGAKFCVHCGCPLGENSAHTAPQPQPYPPQDPTEGVCQKLRVAGILAAVTSACNAVSFIVCLVQMITKFASIAVHSFVWFGVGHGHVGGAIVGGIFSAFWMLGSLGMLGLNLYFAITTIRLSIAAKSDPSLLRARFAYSRPGWYLALNIIFSPLTGIIAAAFYLAAYSAYRKQMQTTL